MDIIYCRGGDPAAPRLAQAAGMRYGVRYDYTAYGDVHMLDGGLHPRWSRYLQAVARYRPAFALLPDYFKSDPIALELYWMDLEPRVQRIGICPKFAGAVAELPEAAVICESIPSQYAGFLIPDGELLAYRDYHLLGGDPRLQKIEIERITRAGGRVISLDGNKLAMKAAHGQVFFDGKWLVHTGTTEELAYISAMELMDYLGGS